VTESGRKMDWRLKQPENASLPIEVTESGREMDWILQP
jgi:hypothetical protein